MLIYKGFRFAIATTATLLLLLACSRDSRPILYPDNQSVEISYICTAFFQVASSSAQAQVAGHRLELVNVGAEKISYIFSNNFSYPIARPSSVTLSSGTYRCP